MDSRILENIGFTKGEIKVYLALLELGNSTSGPIILNSGVARSKVYEILERLKEKGLVSESIQANTRYFQASDPERIMDYMKKQENELKKKEEDFKTLLPELKLKQQLIEEKQEVRIYVGYEGVKTWFSEVLSKMKKGDEYLAMTLSKQSWKSKSLSLFLMKFHQKRAEKGANAKILYHFKGEDVRNKFDFSKTGLYEIRQTNTVLPTGIGIFQDTVVTLTWGETPKIFAIVCKENAEQYRNFFYDIWKDSKTTN